VTARLRLRPPRRGWADRVLFAIGLAATLIPLVLLLILGVHVVWTGWERLDLAFVTSFPSRFPASAGILPGLLGSLWIVSVTAIVALPIGIGTAIYLEEYGRFTASPNGIRFHLARVIDININNLASVPSIIYGLLGLEIFARTLGFGRSLLAGGLTMALLVLPMVIISTREAFRAVPRSVRDAGLALGCSRWQVTRYIVLPMIWPAVLAGSIFAVSRAFGEAAPLIVLGAVSYVDFLPGDLSAPFTALPIQIFYWLSRPQAGFEIDAAAGIVVLLMTLLGLNGFAIYLRYRYRTAA